MLETNRVYAAMGDQPLFKYAVRRVRWAATVEQLRKYNWRVAAIVHLVIVGLWLLAIYDNVSLYMQTGSINPAYVVTGQSGDFIAWLMVISIGMDLILDFASLLFALNSIAGEVSARRWDLLRLSPVREDRIVAAKHGLAQVRAWRVMALVLYTRSAAVLLILLHTFLLPFFVGGGSDILNGFRYEFFNTLIALVIAAIFLVIYVVEPLWRMRAMTAVGIAISARVYSITFAFLTAFAAIVATWITQVMILAMIGWSSAQIVGSLNNGVNASATVFLCIALGACIATAFIVRIYYRRLEDWALGYAVRRIHAEAGR
jgi:hypothetical protein